MTVYELEKPPIATTWINGLDLGQSSDPTALVIVEPTGDPRDPLYDVRHIERLALGTSYPAVVTYVDTVITQLRATRPRPDVHLVIDYTGVGRPVADMFTEAKPDCTLTLVTIHGGDAVSRGASGEYRVPKRDLAGCVQVLLQSKRIRIADDLPMATALTSELKGFKVKINLTTGHDSYGAGEDWRSAPHDDLVLALALALWKGERLARRRAPIVAPSGISRESVWSH